MADKVGVAAFGGKRTPKQTLLDALNHADEMKIAVVVYLDKEDFVNTGWSDGSTLKRMGMMDVAKWRMFNAAQSE